MLACGYVGWVLEGCGVKGLTQDEALEIAKDGSLSIIEQADKAGMSVPRWQKVRGAFISLGILKPRRAGTARYSPILPVTTPAGTNSGSPSLRVPACAIKHIGIKVGDEAVWEAHGEGAVILRKAKP